MGQGRAGQRHRTRPAVVVAATLLLTGCQSSGEQARPTFHRDVAAILHRRCASCHRDGQPGGFPLLTYADAQPRAALIAHVTRERIMPPWLADANEPPFSGERRLTDREIDVLSRWAQMGAPEGDHADALPTPVFAGEWQLGAPDLVVRMPKPYTLMPGSHDVFRNFVIPVALPADRYVRALEFRADAGAPVHHAVVGVDRTRTSRRRDGAHGEPGYDGMFSQGTENPAGHFLGWTPGRGPLEAPQGMWWRLDRGSDFVVQLHLLPQEEPREVGVQLGLYFSDQPPVRVPLLIKLGVKTIDIPAGAADYAIGDAYTLPVDVDLLSVYPHAHYLAARMDATATLPDGTERRLLRIRQWDFHWQQDYRYVAPIALPRGTTLRMRYTYNNSPGNPHNPHVPPRPVTYGPGSHDEMGDLWLQVLPRSAADAAILARAFSERETAANIAGGEMLVRRLPENAGHHAFLGSSYLDAGRIDDAVARLRQALALDPAMADAHNSLGRALLVGGRPAEAVKHFKAAVASDPADDLLRFNLAGALHLTRDVRGATAELQQAVALNPDFAEAHNNLGVLLGMESRFAQALVHLERAVELSPDYADAHRTLGAALAGVGQIDRAITHLRRALDLRPDDLRTADMLLRLMQRR